jgi:uncharacterized protein YegJ (DUF2314 family)
MSDEDLVPLFIPALGAILLNAEDSKGSPLTEQEVLHIRDHSSVIMVTREHAEKMAESRGYDDIDPENCWFAWQMLRRELGRQPDIDPGAKMVTIDSSDAAFQATIAAAQTSLAEFRRLIEETKRTQANPLVKVRLAEPDCAANMWLLVCSDFTTGFVGEVYELPGGFKQYKVGQQIEIPDSDVQDWMINDSGTLFGGYSIRYSRARMSEAEQAAFDEHIGVSRYF